MPKHIVRLRLSPIVRSFVAAALCVSATEVAAQVNLEVLRSHGYGVVPIDRPRPNDLLVRAVVNGQPLALHLDTGWGGHGLTLNASLAAKLGLSTVEVKEHGRTVLGQEIAVRRGVAREVSLGNALLKGVPVHFGVFKGLRTARSSMGIFADGFLSAGFLRTCSAVVDLHNLRLYLRPPGSGHRVALGPALKGLGLAEAPFLQSGSSNCYVDVEMNGVPGKMIIDTGATLSVVDSRFAAQIKAKGFRSNLEMTDAAGVTRAVDRVRVNNFKIGGVNARVPEVVLSSTHPYAASKGKVLGLMGMDILGQNWGIIDFGSQKLYFAAAK